MTDLLEYYKIHISQLSPLGMVRACYFEYCFWSQKIEPTIEHFRRFYRLQAQLGFYSFFAHRGVKRILVVPPKGFHELKSNFFYIKVAAIACRLEVRSVYRKILREALVVLEFQECKGRIVTESCDAYEEGWYETIVQNFRVPDAQALEALIAPGLGMSVLNPRSCKSMTPVSEELFSLSSDDSLGSDSSAGVLVALGAYPTTVESGKAQKTKCQKKPAALVSKQTGTGIFRPRKTPSEDYVLVSDTLEGLDILGATIGTGSADASTGVLTKVTPAPGVEGSGSSNLERTKIVRKRKLMSMPAGAPLKKPTLRLQKTTDLDAHEVLASVGKF
ncbi:hypothetical protein Hdeb2414_s0020g00556001 [Helianthus debilis subsp. tardiflorus]